MGLGMPAQDLGAKGMASATLVQRQCLFLDRLKGTQRERDRATTLNVGSLAEV